MLKIRWMLSIESFWIPGRQLKIPVIINKWWNHSIIDLGSTGNQTRTFVLARNNDIFTSLMHCYERIGSLSGPVKYIFCSQTQTPTTADAKLSYIFNAIVYTILLFKLYFWYY